MFRTISRRLAILNALVVIAVIAAVGLASYFYLARKIETQTNAELRSRSVSAVELWTNVFLEADAGSAGNSNESGEATQDDDEKDRDHEDDDDDEHQARELLRSGDTIAYGIDLDGKVISMLRPIDIEHLPKEDSIERALRGSIVVETTTVEHERVRLRSEPVFADGRIIGAIQVGMGLGPNERVLEFVRWSTVGGLLLGALLAVPSGWLLANRSMRPIREAFSRQRAFVADAAHELRTPLTLIRAEAEYLQQAPDLSPPDRHESEATIVREVDSMAGLVTNLLQLARMDEHRLHFQTERLDLMEICDSVIERLGFLAAERNVTLIFERGAPILARCDRAATEQVLTIVLDNAIAYTPSEGHVILRPEISSGKAVIAVSDTGIGISPEDQKLIFNRFYRSDPARSRSSGGAGLGLSIAAELMAAQHGGILVESELGSGSTFTLQFETSS